LILYSLGGNIGGIVKETHGSVSVFWSAAHT